MYRLCHVQVRVSPTLQPAQEEEALMPACASCSASILWIRTPKGKAMPLDATPNPNGNVVIRDGLAVVLNLAELETTTERKWLAHWASCPNAIGHRKAKT
jgi:hypothetical protein